MYPMCESTSHTPRTSATVLLEGSSSSQSSYLLDTVGYELCCEGTGREGGTSNSQEPGSLTTTGKTPGGWECPKLLSTLAWRVEEGVGGGTGAGCKQDRHCSMNTVETPKFKEDLVVDICLSSLKAQVPSALHQTCIALQWDGDKHSPCTRVSPHPKTGTVTLCVCQKVPAASLAG